jgi:hypothetical protein
MDKSRSNFKAIAINLDGIHKAATLNRCKADRATLA